MYIQLLGIIMKLLFTICMSAYLSLTSIFKSLLTLPQQWTKPMIYIWNFRALMYRQDHVVYNYLWVYFEKNMYLLITIYIT